MAASMPSSEGTTKFAEAALPPPLPAVPEPSTAAWAQALASRSLGSGEVAKTTNFPSIASAETTRKKLERVCGLLRCVLWSFCHSFASAPKSTRATKAVAASPVASARAARSPNAPAATWAFFAAAAFCAALSGPATSAAILSRPRILSAAGSGASVSMVRAFLMPASSSAAAASVLASSASSPAKYSRIAVPAASDSAAFSRVAATMRRTPLAMPDSSRTTKPTASAVLRRCVPPQSSMEYAPGSATAEAVRPSTVAPTATTRTGSGYVSPFMWRSDGIARAVARGVSRASTARPSSIWRRQIDSTARSSASDSGASHAKSKRSRSSSTKDPRWAHLASSSCLEAPPTRTSRSAKLSTCVIVWFGAIFDRRS
mmetsp:Transcript_15100/g.60660  ORF Transcript_15100/g.60660 Transcript_15100/m.60660 type:complete len:373 (-) Transcript_15100:2040-3158(-)